MTGRSFSARVRADSPTPLVIRHPLLKKLAFHLSRINLIAELSNNIFQIKTIDLALLTGSLGLSSP